MNKEEINNFLDTIKKLISESQLDEALSQVNHLIQQDRTVAEGWFLKGNILYATDEYHKALECFEIATMLEPEYSDALINKGTALTRLDKFKEAEECFDKVLQNDPSYCVPWYNKGNLLARSKNYDEALICFDRAIEIDPYFSLAWHEMGMAYSENNNNEKALESLCRACELEPRNQKFLQDKAKLLKKLGRKEEAQKVLEKINSLQLQ